MKGNKQMNKLLLDLFNAYKKSNYYNEHNDININWLETKLDAKSYDELEAQFLTIFSELEEEIFIETIQFILKMLHDHLLEDRE